MASPSQPLCGRRAGSQKRRLGRQRGTQDGLSMFCSNKRGYKTFVAAGTQGDSPWHNKPCEDYKKADTHIHMTASTVQQPALLSPDQLTFIFSSGLNTFYLITLSCTIISDPAVYSSLRSLSFRLIANYMQKHRCKLHWGHWRHVPTTFWNVRFLPHPI